MSQITHSVPSMIPQEFSQPDLLQPSQTQPEEWTLSIEPSSHWWDLQLSEVRRYRDPLIMRSIATRLL